MKNTAAAVNRRITKARALMNESSDRHENIKAALFIANDAVDVACRAWGEDGAGAVIAKAEEFKREVVKEMEWRDEVAQSRNADIPRELQIGRKPVSGFLGELRTVGCGFGVK